MNMKEQIEKVVSKISGNKDLMAQFKENPIKAVESIIGVDLPDDIMSKVVDGVKAALAGEKLSGALGSIKKLF